MAFPAHRAAREESTALAIIGIALAVQIVLAIRYFGFFIGDDVEMVARAFHVADGLWYRAWDIRCLFVPDTIVATPIRIASLFGVRDRAQLLGAATMPFLLVSALTNWLVYRLAIEWTGDRLAALSALSIYAFHWIPLGFGSMVFPRIVSTFCIVAAALLLTRDGKSKAVIAGVFVAVAFADRFSELVFFVPLFVLARRRATFAMATVLSIVAIVGGYDWITWGTPFGSLIKFAHVTIVEQDFASRVKYQSPLWYLETIVRWCALTLIPLAWFGRKSIRWTFVFLPLIALSIVKHKEMRYVAGVIPFLAIAAAAGFAILWRSDRRAFAALLLAATLIWDLQGLRYLARKSMPAVAAARAYGDDPNVHGIALSQLWAYGDRLFLPPRIRIVDVGTPPENLAGALSSVDTVMLYESDLTPDIEALLRARGLARVHRYDDGRARAVVVYR